MLREEEYIFSKIFISILIFILSTSFISNSIKTILNLRLINIIENCKRK